MHGGIGTKLCLWAALAFGAAIYAPLTLVQLYGVFAHNAVPSLEQSHLSRGWLTREQRNGHTVIQMHSSTGSMTFGCPSRLSARDSCLGYALTDDDVDKHRGIVWWYETGGWFSDGRKRLVRLDVEKTTVITRATVVQASADNGISWRWILWSALTLSLAAPLAFVYRIELPPDESARRRPRIASAK